MGKTDRARTGNPTMRPRRAFRPLPPDPLEGRETPGRVSGLLAHHLKAHRHPRATPPQHTRTVAAILNTQAVGTGTGPVVGGTAGTGDGATLNIAFTYLSPVAPYANPDQSAGTSYGGSTSSATINTLNNGPGLDAVNGLAAGTLGSFNTLPTGLNLSTVANSLDGPAFPISGLGGSASLSTGAGILNTLLV